MAPYFGRPCYVPIEQMAKDKNGHVRKREKRNSFWAQQNRKEGGNL